MEVCQGRPGNPLAPRDYVKSSQDFTFAPPPLLRGNIVVELGIVPEEAEDDE